MLITKDNLSFCFDSLDEHQINNCFNNEPYDYIYMHLATFNTGSFAMIDCLDYSNEKQEEAECNGDLFLDKDQFLQLFKESNSTNPFIIELL